MSRPLRTRWRLALIVLFIAAVAIGFSFAPDDPSLYPGNQPGYGSRGP